MRLKWETGTETVKQHLVTRNQQRLINELEHYRTLKGVLGILRRAKQMVYPARDSSSAEAASPASPPSVCSACPSHRPVLAFPLACKKWNNKKGNA